MSDVTGAAVQAKTGMETPVEEAVDALIGLGYSRQEALAAVSAVQALADTAEELTLLALKRMSN